MRKKIRGLFIVAFSILMIFALSISTGAIWQDENYDICENLIKNPGFEDDFKDWNGINGEVFVSTTDKYSGEKGLLMGSVGVIKQQVSVPEPGYYHLKLNIRRKYPRETKFTILIQTKKGIQDFSIFPKEEEWQRIGMDVMLDSDATLGLVVGGNSAVALDDIYMVSIRDLKEPATYNQESVNYINNPGAENGIKSWSYNEQTSLKVSPLNPHSGYYNLNVIGTSIFQNLNQLSAGEYEVTAYVFVPKLNENTGKIKISLVGELINAPTISVPITQTGKWTKISFYTYLPSSSYKISFQSEGISEFNLDDLSLCKTGYNYVQMPKNDNLIVNYGFENGLTAWKQIGEPHCLSTSEQAYTGQSSALFSCFSESVDDYISQTVEIKESGTYSYSAYIKLHEIFNGDGPVLIAEAKDKDGKRLAGSISSSVTNDREWQKISGTIVIPGNAELTLKIGGINCIGAFYVDGVRLVKDN